MDYRARLSRLAKLAVPTLADWCAVEIVEDDRLHTLAVAHVDPAKVAWARQLEQRYPTDPDSPTGAPNVVRTGVSELYPEITDEMLVASTRDAEHLRLSRELELRSAWSCRSPCPAHARRDHADPRRRAAAYARADLAMAEELAGGPRWPSTTRSCTARPGTSRCSCSRPYCPTTLDDLPGWEIAAHYSRPAGRGRWRLLRRHPAARTAGLAVVVGDVMGRGVAAAAAMAQMRSAVRAYCRRPAPGTRRRPARPMNRRFGLTAARHPAVRPDRAGAGRCRSSAPGICRR